MCIFFFSIAAFSIRCRFFHRTNMWHNQLAHFSASFLFKVSVLFVCLCMDCCFYRLSILAVKFIYLFDCQVRWIHSFLFQLRIFIGFPYDTTAHKIYISISMLKLRIFTTTHSGPNILSVYLCVWLICFHLLKRNDTITIGQQLDCMANKNNRIYVTRKNNENEMLCQNEFLSHCQASNTHTHIYTRNR